MKNVTIFIAAGIIIFCIVPIATTQAMQRRMQRDNSFALNDLSYVLNQKELHGLFAELGSPAFKDTILTYDLQEPRELTIAQADKAETKPSTDNKNPYVKRRGHGRSKMGDAVAVEDNNSKNEDDGDESVEDEEFGDDSAIKYNKKLKNSSGYNEDL